MPLVSCVLHSDSDASRSASGRHRMLRLRACFRTSQRAGTLSRPGNCSSNGSGMKRRPLPRKLWRPTLKWEMPKFCSA